MPNRELEYRQKLLNNRCRELQKEITELRLKRELQEYSLSQPSEIASAPAPKAETQNPGGGKWFGNGARVPDAQDMNDPQKLKEMLNELSRHTEVDYNSGRVNWK